MADSVSMFGVYIYKDKHLSFLRALDDVTAYCGSPSEPFIKGAVIRLASDPSGLSSTNYLHREITAFIRAKELPDLLSLSLDPGPYSMHNLLLLVKQTQNLLASLKEAERESRVNKQRASLV